MGGARKCTKSREDKSAAEAEDYDAVDSLSPVVQRLMKSLLKQQSDSFHVCLILFP